jgi:hypothetical protein
MIDMSQVQQMYNALVVRGLRATPTYAEVARDARKVALDRIDAQIRF